jgi:hypothetical protein
MSTTITPEEVEAFELYLLTIPTLKYISRELFKISRNEYAY